MATILEEGKWLNEPARWERQADHTISVRTAPKTDFWRVTHYGFVRDNGHFYYQEVEGDFTARVEIVGQYKDLYDQAGLMLRLNADTWLKCGIEFVEGIQNLSAVVTREYSDWSVVPLQVNPSSVWLELRRVGASVEVHYSLDSKKYSLLRMAYLTPTSKVSVGVMCASPDGEGFQVTFKDFNLTKNLKLSLHF